MKLLSVKAANFRSFAELDLDLNVDGLVAVIGPNGAGKSTIFGAIEWALYGQRGRGSLPARRDGTPDGDNCWVEVEFEAGGRSYLVRRVDGKDAKLVDIASREKVASGREETTRRVGMMLGLTREMFRGTFYARQKEVQALGSDTDTDNRRREQVELLLGIERLRRATDRAATAAREQQHLVTTLAADVPDVDAVRAELERIQLEAQATAPHVQRAEDELVKAKEARSAAGEHLEQLRALERELITRQAARDAAQRQADSEARSRDQFAHQVKEAEAATETLLTLTPAAERTGILASEEREMDLLRSNHEQALAVRDRQERALSLAAELSDEIAELEAAITDMLASEGQAAVTTAGIADAHGTLLASLHEAETELESAREEQLQSRKRGQAAESRLSKLRDRIATGERAELLDGVLLDLRDAGSASAALLTEWHTAQASRAQLAESIRHDGEHRDAILAGDAQAECPTCKRPYDDGELDVIIERFETDLRAARERLAAIDDQLAELRVACDKAETRADQGRTAAADRRALGDATTGAALTGLRDELTGAETELATLNSHEEQLAMRVENIAGSLPRLRKQAQRVDAGLRRSSDLHAKHVQALSEAQLHADQLNTVGANGYDPARHSLVREQLAEAVAAGHRCAELRGKADGLDLLCRRLIDQETLARGAHAQHQALAAAAAEVAVDEAAVSAAASEFEQATQNVDTAHTNLIDANRRAASDSEAVAAAHARLQDAKEQDAHLRSQRAELRIRREVADALSAYREEASRRARPKLEEETAVLLGHTTRGRYSSVHLSDAYQLEIVDGTTIHPLKRFSGGEQDLASLCLRLGLSRMLARSRGAETGFVLLDEVFGSQDLDRRHALLEQLRTIAQSEFRQVFVISHTDDVVALCDLTIDVRREDDVVSVASGPHR